jgi:hypothetical protein
VVQSFDLRVVPIGQVVPHEQFEPRRVEQIVQRLTERQRLANPPQVTEVDGRLILLDGANRIAALRVLGFRHAIVQVVRPAQLRLQMWHHGLYDISPARLLAVLEAAANIELYPGPKPNLDPAACRINFADGTEYAVRPEPGSDRLTALNSLVHSYLDQARVVRVAEGDLAGHGDAAAVVTFPRLHLEDIVGGARLPSGVTRFLIDGRVLLLDAPLAPLQSDRSAEELTAWLAELVAQRRAAGKIRHYPEPVFVLDD